MARTYKRDKRGRFAGGGGGGRTGGGSKKGGSKKPRKSDAAFQKSGKGGGKSVKAGRAAKAAYKAKEGKRRLGNLTKRDKGSTRWTKGSQRGKQAAAKRAAKGTGYKRTRKSRG